MASAVHDTAYPRLTENVTVAALQQIYSPSEREIVCSKTHRLNVSSRLLTELSCLLGTCTFDK